MARPRDDGLATFEARLGQRLELVDHSESGRPAFGIMGCRPVAA